MSSRTIIVAGVTYVRSRDAARSFGISPDYASRLARGGLIDGRLVHGLWFVDLASLEKFLAAQERQKEAWRARLAELRREEQRLAGHPSALFA
jgi:hypothetical protein